MCLCHVNYNRMPCNLRLEHFRDLRRSADAWSSMLMHLPRLLYASKFTLTRTNPVTTVAYGSGVQKYLLSRKSSSTPKKSMNETLRKRQLRAWDNFPLRNHDLVLQPIFDILEIWAKTRPTPCLIPNTSKYYKTMSTNPKIYDFMWFSDIS